MTNEDRAREFLSRGDFMSKWQHLDALAALLAEVRREQRRATVKAAWDRAEDWRVRCSRNLSASPTDSAEAGEWLQGALVARSIRDEVRLLSDAPPPEPADG